jgi:two-component system sensor histidine kinase UhpB
MGLLLLLSPMEITSSLSLRARVLVAIALVLAVAATAGGAFAGWHARQSLHEELAAALLGGRQTVASAFEDLPRSDHPARDLDQLIATFDGNRHVQAELIAADGRRARTSYPFVSAAHAPAWFSAWLDPRLEAVRIAPPPVADYRAIVLRPLADDDVGDAWLQFRDTLSIFALACVSGVGLVFLTIGRALRPLSVTSAALARVGAGDYGIRVEETGPRELVQLSRSFNAMAGELAAVRRRNRLLEEQILKLQDEERAEIARDLHDEIGPHLFAVNIDAAMARQSIAAGRAADAAVRVEAIQTAVGHMQRQVKDILSRLRPARLAELGLAAAIRDLADFWRDRRPDIVFAVDLALDDGDASEAVQETLYRVVQEGLSNAIRHARPSRIGVTVRYEDGEIVARVEDDGAPSAEPSSGGGHGLVGMRERVEATGGRLDIARGGPRGWSVTARAPARPPAARTLETAAT